MSDDLVVLGVDDDFHVGRLHAGFVNAVPGFTALTPVGTAEQAMRTVHAHQPDLVLLDVYLPDALGLDLLRALDVDVIMLTAAAAIARSSSSVKPIEGFACAQPSRSQIERGAPSTVTSTVPADHSKRPMLPRSTSSRRSSGIELSALPVIDAIATSRR